MAVTVASRIDIPDLLFTIKEPRTRKFLAIETGVLATFLIYTSILLRLSSIWSRRNSISENNPISSTSGISTLGTVPRLHGPGRIREYADFTRQVAVDVWFGLVLIPAFDATTILATCNRTIISRWHYFIGIRMMVLAYFASFTIILSGKPRTGTYISDHPILVFVLVLVIYVALGACLDRCRALPPKRSMNLRKWKISEYIQLLGRSNGTWKAAFITATLTCGLTPVLTLRARAEWSSFIPVFTIAFEVKIPVFLFRYKHRGHSALTMINGFQAIILRTRLFRRTFQYTLCAAPFFHGSLCVHWGLRQMVASPEVTLSPWIFLHLLVGSRLVLDLHLGTVFRDCAEFHWARNNAVISTRRLVQVAGILLVLEHMQVPVVRWVKPATVLIAYLLFRPSVLLMFSSP
jgi:hypothetical protein